MRTSLSCEFCRRSKIRCVNSGTAPCRKCDKSGNPDCRLSRPQTKSQAKTPRKSRERHSAARSPAAGEICTSPIHEDVEDGLVDVTEALEDVPAESRPGLETSQSQTAGVDEHLISLPLGTILKALNIFTNKVPELRVLHPTAFVKQYQGARSRESKALLATVLSVVKTLPSTSNAPELHDLLPASRYEKYAQDVLLASILLPPKVEVVQGLLILAFYEWGTRDFHQAWVHCGIAIRIMQSLHSSRVAPYPLDISQHTDADELSAAVEARTYWACFIMDCTINSGLYTPRMLPMAEMRKLRVSHPLSTIEFAFGSKPRAQQIDSNQASPSILDPSQSFEIMVGGFDIYSQVMAFVFNDGRRAPGMCRPENCPWTPGSPWDSCRSQLERWRMGQHKMLHYPENSVAVHMTLGYGESFVYLNLLYYMCRLMLQREYSPFLPTPETTPRGPIDPPLLEEEAPPGWWENSTRELFESGERVTSLLHDASLCGVSVCTPFTGFCAFTACFLNLYVTYFPNMNLGRSPNSKVLMERGHQYLKDFQNIWALGDGWARYHSPPFLFLSASPLTEIYMQVKTLRTASVLYERATSDRQLYRNKSRFDFEALHHSVHEFRVVDRSEEHMQQINRAETQPASPANASLEGTSDPNPPEANLAPFPLAEIDGILDDQLPGMWPNWWSSLEDVDLSGAFTGG